ncbi:histidine kinase [Cohnella xylanilytica]|uniref:Sensor histidine kinase n=1 Tax=Cohnella xylanilytica TaxID=557555 RepID=A0A841U577_9BACL|nr:sensor histidine kinase [Cohnella xylanilytica]MBB6693221.1 sensor histidine kinase [Cohnella xylanilytica]GIO13390.1 histidine kinase [Cohnella xylanilytica]
MPRINLFRKIVLVLAAMLVLIAGLYSYSNRTSTDVLREELNRSNTSKLDFFQSQLNANIDSISLWPNLLIHDPDISELKDAEPIAGPYLDLEQIELVKRIQQKLSTQESSINWKSSLYIYSPKLNRMISDTDAVTYDDGELKSRMKQGWQVMPIPSEGEGSFQFSLLTVAPFKSFHNPADASLIIEVRFRSQNLVSMLDDFKSDSRRDPFLYKQGVGMIFNSSADRSVAKELADKLERQKLMDASNQTISLHGEKYLVNTKWSPTTEWYLIDYIPYSDVVGPIEKSNKLFYLSIGSLLIMGCVLAYLLYAQVQVPMKRLVHSFQRLKQEDYSVRLVPKGRDEFSFVFMRFNSMVEQIQELFDKVYLEKIHVREARLKQLQSQINPHFFYNCFSFISSMAKLGNNRAIVDMSQNLSSYYRYTTRQERDFVKLSEELDFVTSYLEIQRLRMNRLNFEVELPSWLRHLEIPPLLIQPLVENAVQHGIEEKAGEARIRLAVSGEGGRVRIVVEDNGKGMEETELRKLERKLAGPMDEEMGCGLWNVHQRLLLRYGEDSRLSIARSEQGGLRVELEWRMSPAGGKEVGA